MNDKCLSERSIAALGGRVPDRAGGKVRQTVGLRQGLRLRLRRGVNVKKDRCREEGISG